MEKDKELRNSVNGVNSPEMDDDSLRRFFHDNRPSVSDGTTFLAGLSARMDALEGIREIHESEIRRCRRTTVIALVAGVVIGIAAVILLMLGADLQVPLLNVRITVLKGLNVNAGGLTIIAAAAALIYGLCDSFRWKSSLHRH